MRVVAVWEPPDREVLVVRAGEVVTAGRRDSEWPGFVWCENHAGVGGWVPEEHLEPVAGPEHRITADYSAAELAVEPGELVEARQSVAGWRWSVRSDGVAGWLPEKVLAATD